MLFYILCLVCVDTTWGIPLIPILQATTESHYHFPETCKDKAFMSKLKHFKSAVKLKYSKTERNFKQESLSSFDFNSLPVVTLVKLLTCLYITHPHQTIQAVVE